MIGAVVLAFFSILAPMIGDPAARLLALDTFALSTEEAIRDVWAARTFEFTPTTLGPTIDTYMVALVEDEDTAVLTMPELEVHARPPIDIDEPMPPG